MIGEEWRDIPGYEGRYQASTMGRVRSLSRGKARVLKGAYRNPRVGSSYVAYHLTIGEKKYTNIKGSNIMRDTFMGGAREGYTIHHINGLKSDNRLCNLEFISLVELGRKYGAEASRRPVRKIDEAGNVVALYPSARKAAKANHMCYQTVLDRCNGKVKHPYALDGHDYRFDDDYYDDRGKRTGDSLKKKT